MSERPAKEERAFVFKKDFDAQSKECFYTQGVLTLEKSHMHTEQFFRDLFGKTTGDEIHQFFTHEELVEISQKMTHPLSVEERSVVREYYGIGRVSRTILEITILRSRSRTTIHDIKHQASQKLRDEKHSRHILKPLRKRQRERL